MEGKSSQNFYFKQMLCLPKNITIILSSSFKTIYFPSKDSLSNQEDELNPNSNFLRKLSPNVTSTKKKVELGARHTQRGTSRS